jgi:ATP-dependent Clp protease, protease subunit
MPMHGQSPAQPAVAPGEPPDTAPSEEPDRESPTATDVLGRLSVFERLHDRRIVFLRGALQETTADELIAQLLALDHDSTDDVTLYIDSPGGNTFGMFALHDVIQSMRSTVHTRCVGIAASAGGFLLATGTGVRSATANASIMLHQPWGGIGRATAIDIARQAEQFAETRRRMEAILAERTGQPLERIERDIDRDLWLTAHEALAYGVIDEVVGAGRQRLQPAR